HQPSVTARSYTAKGLDYEPPDDDLPAVQAHLPLLRQVSTEIPEETVLIDLPGKMADGGLIPVILSGDLILCPFNYDEFSVDSTLLFAMVAGKINNRAPIVFIPNRIKATVRYDTRKEVDKVLAKFWRVMPGIADHIDFQRVDTLHTPAIVLPAVLPLLDLIYGTYINKEAST